MNPILKRLYIHLLIVSIIACCIAFTRSSAEELPFVEDEFVIVTDYGAEIVYEDELVKRWGNFEIYSAYFVDCDALIPCEVLTDEWGVMIRLFSVRDYNCTIESWRCTWVNIP